MKLVIDISYYQGFTETQWDLLATVLDGVIIRMGYGLNEDSAAKKHILSAVKRNIPYSGYHWVDITTPRDRQINYMKDIIKRLEPRSYFLDFEQYWTDWEAYMSGNYAKAYETRQTPEQINTFNYNTYLGMSNSEVPVGVYCADWFIGERDGSGKLVRGYAPEMKGWVLYSDYWEALYLRYSNPQWWEGKQIELGKNFPIREMKELAEQIAIPNGIGRQFESYIEVGGLNPHLDWNVFTDVGFNKMFAIEEPVEIPDQTLQERLMRPRLKHGRRSLRNRIRKW